MKEPDRAMQIDVKDPRPMVERNVPKREAELTRPASRRIDQMVDSPPAFQGRFASRGDVVIARRINPQEERVAILGQAFRQSAAAPVVTIKHGDRRSLRGKGLGDGLPDSICPTSDDNPLTGEL